MLKQCIASVVAGASFLMASSLIAAGPVYVEVRTSMGAITLELDPEKAPVTVDNFLGYVKDGYYEGTIFHRVIQTFMIQGGGYDRKAPNSEKGGTRAPIKNESSNGLSNVKYSVAMARTAVPDSATSQFFINTGDRNQFLDKRMAQDGVGYCVFGKVVAGQEVVDAIAAGKVKPGGEGSSPVEPVVIEKVTVVNKPQ
jgi:peptidyl-prolyl cis-trans isomerase B (cyclophilin B)